MSCRLLIAPLALGLLAGCATDPVTQSFDPAFGESVKYNAAVQTIDPDPVYAEGGAQPGDHGEKGAEAVERYRKGQVKDVQTMQTTTIAVGAGGPQ